MTSPQDPESRERVRTYSLTLFEGDAPLRLDAGTSLAPVSVAYEIYGELNARRDNAILVCHALTGSAHAAGLSSDDPRSAGWWDPLIGPGKTLDTSRFCVICSNFLGSCYGTTGPSSTNPATGRPYGLRFPPITVRDMVRVQQKLLEALGVRRLHTVIGGSLGGMQVLEWALMAPATVASIIPIATALQHSPWCIGLNDLARQAIMLDPAWENGDYYDSGQPARGLSLARQIAMMSYRSSGSFLERFGRERVPGEFGREHVPDRACPSPGAPTYQVERYLRYQGEKLVDRFDANTYITISRAMDSHDVARGRSGLRETLAGAPMPALCLGIDSDILYPADEQRAIADLLPGGRYREIHSPHGHDAFLMAYDQLDAFIRPFLEEVA